MQFKVVFVLPWCWITKLIIRVNVVSRRLVSCSVFCHRWSISTESMLFKTPKKCHLTVTASVTALFYHDWRCQWCRGKKWECRTVKCKLQSFAGNRKIKPWALGCVLHYALDLESSIYAPARVRNISSVHMQKKRK